MWDDKEGWWKAAGQIGRWRQNVEKVVEIWRTWGIFLDMTIWRTVYGLWQASGSVVECWTTVEWLWDDKTKNVELVVWYGKMWKNYGKTKTCGMGMGNFQAVEPVVGGWKTVGLVVRCSRTVELIMELGQTVGMLIGWRQFRYGMRQPLYRLWNADKPWDCDKLWYWFWDDDKL
jgi:hypothetical protein